MLSEIEAKVITCPVCHGKGEEDYHTGFCPDMSYEWNIEHFCEQNNIERSRVIAAGGAHYTVRCHLCDGERVVYVAPAKVVRS